MEDRIIFRRLNHNSIIIKYNNVVFYELFNRLFCVLWLKNKTEYAIRIEPIIGSKFVKYLFLIRP